MSNAPAVSVAPAAVPTASQPATQPIDLSGQSTSQQQAQAAERMLKLKMNGKEVSMPESEVIKYAQQGKVSDQRFQEAAKIRQEAEAIVKYAKENPTEFFKKTGMNAREWAENFLMQELQRESESPEQRKNRENEEKLRQYENTEKQRKEQEHKAQMQKLEQEHGQRYDQLFTQALQESGLPKTAFTVKRMAELQLLNLKKGFDLKPDQLAKLVREDYANEQKSLLSSLDGDQLIDFLGAEAVKKLSKAQIAKLKAKGITTAVERARPTPNKPDPDAISWREYQKRNRGR
jgi:hypothetical protein